jgi:fatty acid desaturase
MKKNTARVLIDVIFGYVLLIPNIIIFYLHQDFLLVASLALFIWNALVFHYLTLFIHAGAHYEFDRGNKSRNDLLSNVFIGYPFLLSVEAYRRKHFLHHKNLGSDDDPENSYKYEVNLRNFLSHFFFLIPISKVLKSYFAREMEGAKLLGEPAHKSFFYAIFIFGGIHGALLFIYGSYGRLQEYFLTIFIPLFMMLPVLGWIRTCAEHRGYCHKLDKDVVCRNFRNDFLGFFLGAAGFRNHALHHASPGTEYFKLQMLSNQDVENELVRDSYLIVILRLIFSGNSIPALSKD